MSTCRKSKNCPSGYKCKGNLFGLKRVDVPLKG